MQSIGKGVDNLSRAFAKYSYPLPFSSAYMLKNTLMTAQRMAVSERLNKLTFLGQNPINDAASNFRGKLPSDAKTVKRDLTRVACSLEEPTPVLFSHSFRNHNK